MVIGIDTSRAFATERTGTENYSYHLITQMLRLPSSKKHTFVLFIRPSSLVPKELAEYSHVIVRTVQWPILWTQGGLAWETWRRFEDRPLDCLWIPAHTLPVLGNPRVRTVVTIHGLEYRWLPEYSNWLQRWYLPLSTIYAAQRADQLICVSESTKRDLLAEVKIDPAKITVIPEGVEINKATIKQSNNTAIYNRYGIKEKKYILFVGTVQPRKNISMLIRAYDTFCRTHPEYKLVIAGGVGWSAETDLALPEQLGLSDVVIFTGRVTDLELRALYLGAITYVQPSYTEGFGLPVLEAMGYNLPVISSQGGALPEVVGGAGIIVSQTDFVAGLAAALEQVVSDQSLRQRLTRAGNIRVKQLTWERAAKATLTVLVRG
jgi:glycosyltransferase involved in cell wall biosynthesis